MENMKNSDDLPKIKRGVAQFLQTGDFKNAYEKWKKEKIVEEYGINASDLDQREQKKEIIIRTTKEHKNDDEKSEESVFGEKLWTIKKK